MSDAMKTDAERLEALKETLEIIAGLSSDGLSKILGVTKLALLALETPAGHRDPEMIAQALLAVEYFAESLSSQIQSEASAAGVDAGFWCSRGFVLRYEAKRSELGLPSEFRRAKEGESS